MFNYGNDGIRSYSEYIEMGKGEWNENDMDVKDMC